MSRPAYHPASRLTSRPALPRAAAELMDPPAVQQAANRLLQAAEELARRLRRAAISAMGRRVAVDAAALFKWYGVSLTR